MNLDEYNFLCNILLNIYVMLMWKSYILKSTRVNERGQVGKAHNRFVTILEKEGRKR